MAAARSGARQWIAAGALFLSALWGCARAAQASTTTFDVADGSVVQIITLSANVTIRTWDRNTVRIEFPDDATFDLSRRSLATTPVLYIKPVIVANGSTMATLLPEDFPIPKLAPVKHEIIRVKEIVRPSEPGQTLPAVPLTVTIPASTGMVSIRANDSAVTLHDYRGTTAAVDARGRIIFDHVGGDAFVQPLYGAFSAIDSIFDRLRIRSDSADEIFEGCRVRQIEATTLTGDIVYDNGTFDPGLAQFESDRGSIALGVNGGAQLGARAPEGRVLSALPSAPAALAAPVIAQPDPDRLKIAGDGGPLVSVFSMHGDVLLYDGSLSDRHAAALGPAWGPIHDLLVANRASTRRAIARERRRPEQRRDSQ